MDRNRLEKLLQDVADKRATVEEAVEKLKTLPYDDLGFAKIDNHRALRDNFPEVIFCPGKAPAEVASIIERMNSHRHNILATKANQEVYSEVVKTTPAALFHERSNLIAVVNQEPVIKGTVAVITAGTADIPIAEEAAICLELMGAEVRRIFDVGVAGIHRILDRVQDLNQVQVIIVVAGMEGALASVVGGLTSRPVIAVPTSVGYGANFGGIAALLSMLNTCASGVGVVNIDNGYGAAALAFAILNSKP
ncbi:MAG: nickel pincer cofactor biosynthesis protein LarB [Ignavibacteriales bacterium]